jgi:hypothetical protein
MNKLCFLELFKFWTICAIRKKKKKGKEEKRRYKEWPLKES